MNKGKKFLSAVLAVAMTASLSVTAFAATAAGDQSDTIQVSNVLSSKTESTTFISGGNNGDDDKTIYQDKITYSVVPIGTTITTNSNGWIPGKIHSYEIYTKESEGYRGTDDVDLYSELTLTSKFAGKLIRAFTYYRGKDNQAFLTDAWFLVDGSAPAVTPTVPADTTKPDTTKPDATKPAESAKPAANTKAGYKSDTGKHLDVNVNGVYQFKITSLNGKKPSFQVAGKAFQTTYMGKKGNDYFYLVKAVGKVGQYGGVYINGEKTASTTISIKNNVKSDTGAKLTVKPGKVYQFKLTAGQKPTFVAGNPKAFTVTYNGKKGSDYFYLVKAVGHSGQSTGLYINGAKAPSTIAYIGY